FFDAMHRYFPAFAQHLGFKATYVPVVNRPRQAGTSKYSNIGRAAAGFFDLMGVVWLMRRTHTPSTELLLRPEGRR
ncbi:MAG: glycosyl transferase, partial [Pseudomonadota bacterium]